MQNEPSGYKGETIGTVNKSVPLPILMSHILHAFVRDYAASSNQLPSAPMLNNVLRVVGSPGVSYNQLGRHSILSDRVVRVAIRFLEEDGWLTTYPSGVGRDKLIQLTPEGKRARARGLRRQTATERKWEGSFGNQQLQDLRTALAAVVQHLDVELPHYITSYGQGDPSITGGGYVPAELGPPVIPAHGNEWPVVPRKDEVSVANLPLIALLSQALAAFTIDYDESVETVMGGLHGVTTFLRSLGKYGMPLSEAKKIADVNGTGRAGLERHGLVVVKAEAGARGNQRTVFLTALGRRVCNRFSGRLVEIEHHWSHRYGSKVVELLRSTLESMDQQLDTSFPDYPETREWIQRRS